MQAFKNDPEMKISLLAEIEKHRLADQIIRGSYGKEDDGGKWNGCAIACSIRSYNLIYGTEHSTSDHGLLGDVLDIPQVLLHLEDGIFEGLPWKLAKEWPGKFCAAIRVGADLSGVWPKFAIWLLVDPEHGVIQYAKSEKAKLAIERVAELYRAGGTKEQFLEARKASYAADYYTADNYAVYAADAAAAAYDAAYAVYAVTAGQKAFTRQSEKLLELLAEV